MNTVIVKLKLRRDEPIQDLEILASGQGFPWRCDVWEETEADDKWPLFATDWGRSRLEAMAKANSIVQLVSTPGSD